MSEKETKSLSALTGSANAYLDNSAGAEGTLLAITASYLAGKEAGKREAANGEAARDEK